MDSRDYFSQVDSLVLFADVILPIPIPQLFTYHVPEELIERIELGSRVLVHFGRKKLLTGVVGKLHNTPPQKFEAKPIRDILDDIPIINAFQIGLFKWISEYYMCTIGEVLNVALPSGFKLTSDSKIQKNPNSGGDEEEFSDKEQQILNALNNNRTLDYSAIGEILDQKNYHHILKSLIHKNAILIFEEVKEKYKPKIEKRIRLSQSFVDDKKKLEQLFEQIEKYPRQVDVLIKFLQDVPVFRNKNANLEGLRKADFQKAGFSASAIASLAKKKVFEEFDYTVSRLPAHAEVKNYHYKLTTDQVKVRNNLLKELDTKDIALLHGVTGSGKTEIYIDLIQQALDSGSQVLYLLPEIALTTHIVERLKLAFGTSVGVYHSKFSDNERVEVWKGVKKGEINLVVGVRSSVFLPFDNLGLIIVDEEHENTFKQFDPSPRYHARDTVLVLARLHHAKVLLGSATPAIETFYHCRNNKYGYASLSKRFGQSVLPAIELIDLRQQRKEKQMYGDFSRLMIEALRETINNKDQAIIFHNRRGYSPHVRCQTCSWIPRCDNCSVSLTYHLSSHDLVCHYCGHREKLPGTCAACGSTDLKTIGFGTEKLEDDIKLFIPEARVRRMDLDTTRSKYGHQKILEDFSQGNIDILVGTQMISKGLDFDRVSLVGILDVDRMMHFPDFRAQERTFQLVTQVSGRAGRREKPGRVLIQTANPNQPLLSQIIMGDFENFFAGEIAERKIFNYPPFVRLIRVLIRDRSQEKCIKAATYVAEVMRGEMGRKRVLGPEEPPVNRVRNLYLNQILIKIERERINLTAVKEIIQNIAINLGHKKEFKKSSIVFDVDPY